MVRLPSSDGARLAELYRVGEVISTATDGGFTEVLVRLEGWQADRLRDAGVEVNPPPALVERRAAG